VDRKAGTLVIESHKAEGLMTVKVVTKKGEDGYFVVNCPSLRSCWSQGKSKEEALENIREAIALYLEPHPTAFTRMRPKKSSTSPYEVTSALRPASAGCIAASRL
jgi:predicted RNase H-like HicB family nuclease